MADALPGDALAAVFAHLNPLDSLACRGVCRRWSESAGRGILILHVRARGWTIGSVTLGGRALAHQAPRDAGHGEEGSAAGPAAPAGGAMDRTRGRLPKPAALLTQDVVTRSAPARITFSSDRLVGSARSEALEAGEMLSLRTPSTDFRDCRAAIQMESVLSSPLVILDLGSSSSCSEYAIGAETAVEGEMIRKKKPLALQRSLAKLDVSGLRFLKELSVRGCGSLLRLNLPPAIRSVDAGTCSVLSGINFPGGSDGSLQRLDIGGCRRLRAESTSPPRIPRPGLLGSHTGQALKNVVNLDASQIHNEAVDEVLCDALRSTASLETFSMRHSAADEALEALAESESARGGTLRLVDIAFSTNVTDRSVQILARSATKLERLNMRGCKKVSGGCYNHIPIYLERRRRREEVDDDESFKTCSRMSVARGKATSYFTSAKSSNILPWL